MKTSLQFTGDLAPFLGLLLAFGLGALAFVLYRRETRERSDRLRWLLPALRGTAIFLAVLALTGPILHHERVIRELGKLFVFVDGSKSMGMTDEGMAPERKVASMQAMGILPRAKAAREAAEADALLSRAQFVATRAIDAGAESPDLVDAAATFDSDIEAAFEALDSFTGEIGDFAGAPGQLIAQRYNHDDRFFDRGFRSRPNEHPKVVQTRYLSSFHFPKTSETDFTLWVRGYLLPPADGNYRFWIASDDRGELWLSPDAHPQRAGRIASLNNDSEEFDFDSQRGQRSREIRLKKGERYYIEAILDAGPGQNHLTVAWQAPGADRVGPVPGEFFMPADPLRPDGGDQSLDAFRDGLLAKSAKLKKTLAAGTGDPFAHLETFKELDAATSALTTHLREHVLRTASAYYAANKDSANFKAKLAEFDALDRKSRVERLLLNKDTGVLPMLAEGQDIEFIALRGTETDALWWQRRGGRKSAGPLPVEIKLTEPAAKTDLGDVVKEAIGEAERGVGVLVFSDGQHNVGTSPIAAAKVLGEQGIPIFTVGTGALDPPEDMAVVDVTGPDTVFSKDRVKGMIKLRDTIRNGGEFKLKIAAGDEVVWSETFDADGSGEREFDYDFAVEELAAAYQQAHAKKGIEFRSVPLAFEVRVEPAVPFGAESSGGADSGSGAAEPVLSPTQQHLAANDSKPLFVQAVAQARKVLLLDARPRWETRYLHNMFERDEQWEVNAIMSVFTAADRGKGWTRGTEDGTFPDSREELFKYESIFIGDVPRFLFTDEELGWLLEFVESRGGGLVFMDGQRGHLRGYGDTPLEKLLPAKWLNTIDKDLPQYREGMPTAVRLTSAGSEFAPLRFASTGSENAEIWGRMRPPHWCATVKALPGAEVLAHADFPNGQHSPALVWRRLGAGKVLYSATDELWRWRYNVADRYHQKFWIQMANWVGEKPFSVAGPRASIGTGKLVYEPGGAASIRVRVRDEDGKPVSKGDYIAVLYDASGGVAAEVELEGDDNGGGMFRGRTGELSPGEYEIAVRQKYFLRKATEFDARAPLMVKAAGDRELDDLALDRELLQNIARASGGQYFAEEESRNLVDLLESIDRKKVIPSQTVLWSSYWWFVSIIGLLTAEWILRKRFGYV